MRYQAILFDFDGVLVDSEPVHFECWREILRDFDVALDWETYSRHGIGISDRDLMALLCRRAAHPIAVDQLLAQYPRKRELFRTRMLERNAVSHDVVDLLNGLNAYQLGVVTSSGRAEVEPILEKAGIRRFFRAVICGGDVKRLKPAPDPYLLAVQRLGVRSALALEDSDAGETSARTAGLDVLRVGTPAHMPQLLRARLDRAAL